jgi:hypothetical protein
MARRNKNKIYSIILTNHGKQKETICSEATEEKIYKRYEKLLKENKKVVFPVRFNNEQHVMVESEHELVIIKCRDEYEKKETKIKTDSGEFAIYETTDDDWIVIDRTPYNIEETFWVYGYHPRIQRKTFEWIFENFVLKDSKNKYMFKSIQIYLNKVLFDCNGELEMVICKNKQDAIRMYNLIEEYAKKKRCKYVMFMGDLAHSKYRSKWFERIKKLTNWSDTKIRRPSTRP